MEFIIVAGSYERLLYGLSGKFEDSYASISGLEPEFIYPAHITCIKALAGNHRFLATGSSDEHIKLYDLKIKKEIGSLMHHTGSITCLKFFKKSHLMTASEDGTITIVRTSDWEVLKTLTGHKYAVNWIDIHPTGKVMLSVGREGTLKCWDLSRGNCAYSMKLPKRGDRVLWSPDGDLYAVLMDTVVQVHKVDSGDLVGKLEYGARMNAMLFTRLFGDSQKQVIVTGGEDEMITVWNMDGSQISQWKTGDGARVKDMDCLISEEKTFVTTCSSNGKIKVWNLGEMVGNQESKAMLEYDAKVRLTCVLMKPSEINRKSKNTEDEKIAEYMSEYEEEKPKNVVKVTIEGVEVVKKAKKAKKKRSKTSEPLKEGKKQKLN